MYKYKNKNIILSTLTQGLHQQEWQPGLKGHQRYDRECRTLPGTPSVLPLPPLALGHQRHGGSREGGHRRQHCPHHTGGQCGGRRGAEFSSHWE